jgi:hypothetical protein
MPSKIFWPKQAQQDLRRFANLLPAKLSSGQIGLVMVGRGNKKRGAIENRSHPVIKIAKPFQFARQAFPLLAPPLRTIG